MWGEGKEFYTPINKNIYILSMYIKYTHVRETFWYDAVMPYVNKERPTKRNTHSRSLELNILPVWNARRLVELWTQTEYPVRVKISTTRNLFQRVVLTHLPTYG